MCDEAMIARWARERLSRRRFGAMAALAAAAACTPFDAGADDGEATRTDTLGGFPTWTEQAVSFETSDGVMDGWLVAATSGPAPAVILWPDIAGLRESKKVMARRLADAGHAALIVNQYYRDARAPIWSDFADFTGNGGWSRASGMRGRLDADAVMRDARAIASFLDAQPQVDAARGIGVQGYCMGGPFALLTAAAVPGRVKAAASFHGGGLVREGDPKSPHALMGAMEARLLIAIAQDDDAKAPGDKVALREAANAAGRDAVIEVYAGDHGWCVPDSPSYSAEPAEKAWAALLDLYRRSL